MNVAWVTAKGTAQRQHDEEYRWLRHRLKNYNEQKLHYHRHSYYDRRAPFILIIIVILILILIMIARRRARALSRVAPGESPTPRVRALAPADARSQ